MKKSLKIPVIILGLLFSFSFMQGCGNGNEDDEIIVTNTTLLKADEVALLFMLEEEKLARDTYIYLDDLWSINQFNNIKNSEQIHMNAIENLLKKYKINYTILPVGEFSNQDLQNYYNQFIKDGSINKASALQIGATIED